MAKTPNPLAPVKGAGTTLWTYTGNGDPYSNPLSDEGWTRLAKIKELQPGEITAESYDDNYIDDEDADWSATAQGEKSAGEANITLAWKPGETGQQGLVAWFHSGEVRGYKIKYPNGTVDVFKGWVSSLGKTVTAKEVITRTIKVTNSGRPYIAEDGESPVVPVTGVTVSPATANVAVGETADLTFTVAPVGATDKGLRVSTSAPVTATVTLNGNVAKVKGIKAGSAEIIGMTNDGQFVAIAKITVA
ncbi:Bacterial Ig-like domain (group 2) [Serratia rubidaea]|uniref:Bacterial Ig-like domain (Group 2) n=1 Tax=Serratia rubidaea TaxID=61652 RepID=A0A447QEU0_SERRU|nr:Bacterial Ig-like domain (group 2) [Serratia rubidaea]